MFLFYFSFIIIFFEWLIEQNVSALWILCCFFFIGQVDLMCVYLVVLGYVCVCVFCAHLNSSGHFCVCACLTPEGGTGEKGGKVLGKTTPIADYSVFNFNILYTKFVITDPHLLISHPEFLWWIQVIAFVLIPYRSFCFGKVYFGSYFLVEDVDFLLIFISTMNIYVISMAPVHWLWEGRQICCFLLDPFRMW